MLLEKYFLPADLQAQIEAFVEHYNHQRHHKSLDNVTPADVYFGQADAIIKQQEGSSDKPLNARACSTASSPLSIEWGRHSANLRPDLRQMF